MIKRLPFIIFIVVVMIITVICYIYLPLTENSTVIIDNDLTADDVIEITINQSDVELIAKTVYGEARGCSTVEQSAVIWCILNRVDAGYGSIEHVITKPYQFAGYKESNPVKGEFISLAIDVLIRWQAEKHCVGDIGRTLPNTYLWFHGDGKHNIFRDAFSGDYHIWDWSCLNPYP